MRHQRDHINTFKRPTVSGGRRPTSAGRKGGVCGESLSNTTSLRKVGNPGEYLGLRQVRFKHEVLGWTTGQFHVIRVVKGTWLSAATKKFGWGNVYGQKDGYGAYVEGIVRREDGSYASTWENHSVADHIIPGQLFAIEVYRQKTDQNHRWKKELEKLSADSENIMKPNRNAMIGLASASGLTVDFLSNFSKLGLLAYVSIIFNLKAVSHNPNVAMATVRARCYAATAFIWQEYQGAPLRVSRVYDREKWKKNLYRKIQDAWDESWKETNNKLEKWLTESYTKIYKEVTLKGGDVTAVGELQLRKHITRLEQERLGVNTSAEYCDKLLEKFAGSNWWADGFPATVMPIWEYDRKTLYPN